MKWEKNEVNSTSHVFLFWLLLFLSWILGGATLNGGVSHCKIHMGAKLNGFDPPFNPLIF